MWKLPRKRGAPGSLLVTEGNVTKRNQLSRGEGGATYVSRECPVLGKHAWGKGTKGACTSLNRKFTVYMIWVKFSQTRWPTDQPFTSGPTAMISQAASDLGTRLSAMLGWIRTLQYIAPRQTRKHNCNSRCRVHPYGNHDIPILMYNDNINVVYTRR